MTRPCPSNDQAAAWALHALEAGEEMAVRTHLRHCASCQEVVKDTELAMAALGSSVEQVDPPPRLRDNILAFAAATPQAEEGQVVPLPEHRPERTATVRARRSTVRRRLIAAALVAAGVFGVGGLAAYTSQVVAERDAAVAQAQRIAEAVRPGAARATLRTLDGAAVATVFIADGRPTVVTAGLAPNDPGATIYTVWGIEGDTPHAIGTFDVASTVADAHTIGASAQPYAAYAISLEPGRTAPTTPTTVVASGAVES